jgi:hypothetical protein
MYVNGERYRLYVQGMVEEKNPDDQFFDPEFHRQVPIGSAGISIVFGTLTLKPITKEPPISKWVCKPFSEQCKKFALALQRSIESDGAEINFYLGSSHVHNKYAVLNDVKKMKNFYSGYSSSSAKEIINSIPKAWKEYNRSGELEGSRWGPTYISRFCNINPTTLGRYFKVFNKVGIHDLDGVRIPYRPRSSQNNQ